MTNNILIAGCATQRGIKVTRFLQHKGFTIFGVDHYEPVGLDSMPRFFKIDMKHRESMNLVFTIAKPEVVIFCPEVTSKQEYNYPAYLNLLTVSSEFGCKNNILCIDVLNKTPKNINEVSQTALCLLSDVFKNNLGFETLVITEDGNLLKEIKYFMIQHKIGVIEEVS